MNKCKVGLVGHTIAMQSGQYFDYLDPQPEQIQITDIAQALSNIGRFNGHCEFYSVAEHSLHCAQLAIDEGQPDAIIFAALMHDAQEAYMGDMCKPLKNIMPEYAKLEDKVELVVRSTFEIDHAFDVIVKGYDLQMLKAEKAHLFPKDTVNWFGFDKIVMPEIEIQCWVPQLAELKFLKLYKKYRPFDCICSFGTCDHKSACRKLGMCRYKHHKEVING